MIRLALPPGVERHKVTDRAGWLARRQADVTASAIAALLDAHEFITRFAYWHEKAGKLGGADQDETPAMRRGRLLEPVALAALREDRPDWKIAPGTEYFRDPTARIGGTPDAFARDPERHGYGVVQIKSVERSVFARKWVDAETGEVTAPLYAVVQAIAEAKLTGAAWAVVVAFVVGFGVEVHVVDVPIHEGVWTRLRNEVATFWTSIANDAPPDPDFARDGDLIARLYADDDGREVDLSADNRLPDLVAERARLQAVEAEARAAGDARRRIDVEILLALRTAARGRLADGTIVEARTVRKAGHYAPPTTYRAVRVRPPKPSAARFDGPF